MKYFLARLLSFKQIKNFIFYPILAPRYHFNTHAQSDNIHQRLSDIFFDNLDIAPHGFSSKELARTEVEENLRQANVAPEIEPIIGAAIKQTLPVFELNLSKLDNVFDIKSAAIPSLISFCHAIGKYSAIDIRICGGAAPLYNPRTMPAYKLFSILRDKKEITIWFGASQQNIAFLFRIWDEKSTGLFCRSNRTPYKRLPNSEMNRLLLEDKNGLFENDFHTREDVDFVFTWVNGSDPEWRNLLLKHKNEDEIDWDRYVNIDELKYSIRSVFLYAPWFRKIFILSNCRPPEWFIPNERVQWIDHSAVIDKRYLPTFNSHVIESHIWRIKDTVENIVYMNDDVFLNQFCLPDDFFTSNGKFSLISGNLMVW